MLRNLLYNCCPIEQSREWQLNIEKLNTYSAVFNGRRLIILRTGTNMASPEEVRSVFSFPVEFIELPNDPQLREASGLLDILGQLESCRSDEITFYAHTKGVSYNNERFSFLNRLGEHQLIPIRTWRNLMYEQCLSDPDRIDRVMAAHSTCGCFRRQFSLKHWAFYGTFFWLRHDKLFGQDWRSRFPSLADGTIETFPSSLFPISDSFCLYEREETQFSLYTIPWPFKCDRCGIVQMSRIGLGHVRELPCKCGGLAIVEPV